MSIQQIDNLLHLLRLIIMKKESNYRKTTSVEERIVGKHVIVNDTKEFQ